ncbi:MAG: DUF937 domain-containing protein [Pirellulaceae bacterium]
MSLLDLVSEHLGEGQIEQISKQLGASKEQTEGAIGMALPTLLGAVAKKAEDQNGAEEIDQHLGDHDGSVFDQLGSLLDPDTSSSLQAFGGGGDLIGSMLGGRKSKVETGIGKASGLSGGQVTSLLGMLAPLVMGAIGKKKQSAGMDLGGLSGMLRGERENIENQSKGGLLAGLLDQDGDGDFDFSDIMKMGMKRMFGR